MLILSKRGKLIVQSLDTLQWIAPHTNFHENWLGSVHNIDTRNRMKTDEHITCSSSRRVNPAAPWEQ